MTKIIGKPVGKVLKVVEKLQSPGIFTGPLNKGWRALILYNRKTSPMPKMDISKKGIRQGDNLNKHYAKEDSNSIAQKQDPWKGPLVLGKESGQTPEQVIEANSVNYTKYKVIPQLEIRNDIIVVNLNTTPATSVIIQNRPDTISVDSTTTWAAVKSMGRNNPFQIYTGAEDSVSFEISWYSVDADNRDDVVNKCKLLESWTKANGYISSPPTLKILWGTSGLFENDTFILTAAPYKLTHFQNATIKPGGKLRYEEGSEQLDLKLLPNMATQTLTFKKVIGANTTHDQMISQEILKRTPGIKAE